MSVMIFLTAMLFVAAGVIMLGLVAKIGRVPSWRILMSKEVRDSGDLEAWRVEQRVAAPWWMVGGSLFAVATIWLIAAPASDGFSAIASFGFVCMTTSVLVGNNRGSRAARRYLKPSIR